METTLSIEETTGTIERTVEETARGCRTHPQIHKNSLRTPQGGLKEVSRNSLKIEEYVKNFSRTLQGIFKKFSRNFTQNFKSSQELLREFLGCS
jgi:hypothetical protein